MKKVLKVKGMTILENMIALALLVTAVAVVGTGFYTAGGFVNKGKMYEEAADKAQCMLESEMFDEITKAFGKNVKGEYNKFDSTEMQNLMRSIDSGYKLSYDKSYYYSSDNWILIKPYSSSDGDLSRMYTDSKCIAASESVNDDILKKIPGMYIYICVPVDVSEIEHRKKEGYSDSDAIGLSDYVPLLCYTGEP